MEKDTLTKELILKDMANSRKKYTPLKRKTKVAYNEEFFTYEEINKEKQ